MHPLPRLATSAHQFCALHSPLVRFFVHSPLAARSRNTQDAGDFHQRLCLRAQLAVPGFGRTESADIFVTHLSLSQEARARTLPEIRRYVAQHAHARPAVLVGDFNGEVGPLDFAGASVGEAAGVDSEPAAAVAESEPALIDLWTHTPPERRWIGHANSPTAHTLRSAATVDKASSCVAAPAMSVAVDASSAGVAAAAAVAAHAPMQALSVDMDRLAPVSAPSGSIRVSPSKTTTSCSDSSAASSPPPTVAKTTSAAAAASSSSSESATACADSSSASLSASWDPALEWTFSAWRPRSRIDYCFGAGALRATEMRLLGVDATPVDELSARGLQGHEGAGGVDSIEGVMYASDHRLLLAVVEAV